MQKVASPKTGESRPGYTLGRLLRFGEGVFFELCVAERLGETYRIPETCGRENATQRCVAEYIREASS